MLFYHGSSVANLTELGVRSFTHDDMKSSVVYLTPNRAYALFYIRDLEVNYVTCGVTADGYIRYDERFLGQLKTLYSGRSGYLYCVSGSFEQTKTRDVWVSKNLVAVEKSELIPDVYAEILRYEETGQVKVNRYENLTDKERHNIYDIIVSSLYKSGLTDKNNAKANFYRDNFPKEWEFVKSHPEMKQKILEEWERGQIK